MKRPRAKETRHRKTWIERTETNCQKCAAPVLVLPAKLAARKYCSKACQYAAMSERSGWETSSYKGDAATRRAFHLRAVKVLPIEGSCERCPEPCALIHHKDENPRNNVISNLERLCRPCHTRHHTTQMWARGQFANRAARRA